MVKQAARFIGHVKLHIPGPVEVSEKTFRAFCTPMIGHRGQGFKDLYAKIQPQLQQLLYTKQLVYISTSSAWGVMEGAIRSLASSNYDALYSLNYGASTAHQRCVAASTRVP